MLVDSVKFVYFMIFGGRVGQQCRGGGVKFLHGNIKRNSLKTSYQLPVNQKS